MNRLDLCLQVSHYPGLEKTIRCFLRNNVVRCDSIVRIYNDLEDEIKKELQRSDECVIVILAVATARQIAAL